MGYNMFAYCNNNPISFSDPDGCAPKWWQSILLGAAVIGVVALATAAIVTTGGGAAAVFATAGKVALGAAKIAATAGATAGIVRVGRSLSAGERDASELGKDFAIGFADGFIAASGYTALYATASLASCATAGLFNNGKGWKCGKWEGGYQTLSTPGISFATHKNGPNGGRSFGVDLDVYNGLHYHTNKFGYGKKSKWIKIHHWEASAIFVGLTVGFSEEWSEW